MRKNSINFYRLTKDEYNYLLPVLRDKLLYRVETEKYYFCGGWEELKDMLSRLKGFYGYFDGYHAISDYKCFKNESLEPFRSLMLEIAKERGCLDG